MTGKAFDTGTSLFRHVLRSELPASELSTDRLSKEAEVILAAGTTATARTLVFISYYILANIDIRHQLGRELEDVMAGYPEKVPPWTQLEKLPFLSALVKEGLR